MTALHLTEQRARELAEEWVAAWNAHDLEAITSLYSPAIVFQTPTIIDSLGVPDGRVAGLQDLREHFARGLQRLPNLRFELEAVYTGVRSIAMTYRWEAPTPEAWVGTPVCELHEYDDQERIERVQALYRGLSW